MLSCYKYIVVILYQYLQVGSIARHELKDNNWLDLIKFITCHVQSSNINEREVSSYKFLLSFKIGEMS